MKKMCILGAGGFIGSHLVKKLKNLNYWVKGVDIKYLDTNADEFIIANLTQLEEVDKVITNDINEVYKLAVEVV